MQLLVSALFEFLFSMMSSLNLGFDNIVGTGTTAQVETIVNNIALLIKPIGYALLGVFALIEFAQLSERAGNLTGFMGTGLVFEILIKLILAKLVIDNCTEICSFIIGITDNIASKITSTPIAKPSFSTILANILDAYPAWWDSIGQLLFSVLSILFGFLSITAIVFVKVIYCCRYFELYIMSAISPIPLSTCLSKTFNVAPNFIKNLFAVGLQGGLLMLVIKIFNIIFINQFNNIGTVSQGNWVEIWNMLSVIFMSSLLLLICSFQTQKWAKSICHAM